MQTCKYCKKEIVKRYNYSKNYYKTQKYCSRICMGEDYKILPGHNKGKHWKNINDFERKSRVSMGSGNPAWRGGVTPEHQRIRNSKEHGDWSKSVINSDKFTCNRCGKVGGRLVAHHIKGFSAYPESRFLISNGVTMCDSCHQKHHMEERAKQKQVGL